MTTDDYIDEFGGPLQSPDLIKARAQGMEFYLRTVRGKSRSIEDCEAIRKGVRAYWSSEEGRKQAKDEVYCRGKSIAAQAYWDSEEGQRRRGLI